MRDFVLFGIDLQNAFGEEGNPLCVPGAPEDMARISELIDKHSCNIKDIVLTLDTHEVDHVGHPGWWKRKDGSEPAPFTPVTFDMVENGEITPKDLTNKEHALEYLSALDSVMIWPVHCVPGTRSYELVDIVENAVFDWESSEHNKVTLVKKGFQKDVESFGVFSAEYHDGSLGCGFNDQLLANLTYRNLPIVVVGEALSHCVRRSVQQLAVGLAQNNIDVEIILVRDCMSNVPGFSEQGDLFLAESADHGIRVCTLDTLEEALA